MLLLSSSVLLGGTLDEYAAKIAPLIDRAKLATLGPRATNPRVQKIVYWLATARSNRVPGRCGEHRDALGRDDK